MRFRLPTALAVAVTSCAFSVPANAAFFTPQYFGFVSGNPLTLTASSTSLQTHFETRSVSSGAEPPATDAAYNLTVSFFSPTQNIYVTALNQDYVAPASGVLTFDQTFYSYGQDFVPFLFKFTALGDSQHLQIENLYAIQIKSGTPNFPTFTALPSTSAVPETGTWLMMIAGFAMIGGVTRRRHNLKVSFG